MTDDRDNALLAALERDARASIVALARTIGLSRSATQDRLGRLERTGAIRRYTIERGVGAAGTGIEALLMVRHSLAGSCTSLVAALGTFPEMIDIQMLAGDPDMIMRVTAASPHALDNIANRVRAQSGVRQVTTHVVLGTRRAGIGT